MDYLKKTLDLLDKIDEQIKDHKATLYRAKLVQMDDEELGYEYADQTGDPDREFYWAMAQYGRKGVIDMLCDSYNARLI